MVLAAHVLAHRASECAGACDILFVFFGLFPINFVQFVWTFSQCKMEVPVKTKPVPGPSPRHKRQKHEEASQHEKIFQSICEVAKENGFLLYRVIDDDVSDVAALSCGLCPEHFSTDEEKAFQRHIIHHFDEGGSSEEFVCPYRFIGCTFCGSEALELDRHIRSHQDPRPEALTATISAPPAKKLILQFSKPMEGIVINLEDKVDKNEALDEPTSMEL